MSDIQFDQGLLIADIAHMPGNACGVWPAFWTTGSNWPEDGEIDIIEGINKQKTTQVALHTKDSCDISTTASELTGKLTATACSTDVGSGGCTVQGTEGSFGDDFNDLNGGIYAMELTSDAIKVWFFSRANIPACITSGHPDTSTFGTPMAVFQGTCNFEKDFTAQQIIFNTDFCGDWAGYSYASSCSLSNGLSAKSSCEAYVGANPSAFTEAYWEIVSVGLYQKGNAAVSSVTSTAAATSTAATSTAATSTAAISTAPTSTPTSAPTTAPITAPTTAPTSTGSALPTSSPSTVTVTSFTSPAPSVQAVSSASSKLTTTTVIVTSYVDVCPTGYTTKTITQTVTYCPADVTSSSIAPVFTTTSKLCTSGCAPSPTTVVVVVPVETSTTPAKATGTAIASGSSPAPGSETATLPALAVSAPGTSKTGVTTAFSPVRTGIYSTGLVPVAPSSATGPAGAKPSSSLPGKGSVTSTGVSPAFTGAGSRITPSAVGFFAAVAAFVLFV
nr:GH16 endo-beta-1,3(4)-glucanase [Talaromyces funiculosus]